MVKKLVTTLIVLCTILAAVGYYAYSNLDFYVKGAIEKYGTLATKTEVDLSGVHIGLTTGEGSLKDLKVANPAGFSEAKALSLGVIDVKLDPNSVMGNGPVIIREVTIDTPAVMFEVNTAGINNLQTLQKNVMAFASSAAGNSTEVKTAAGEPAKPVRKVIINDLYIRNGQITISQPALLKGKVLTETLPTIHLANIGKAKNGALPAEVAKQVLGAITASASQVAMKDILKNSGALKGVLDMGGASLKGLLGR